MQQVPNQYEAMDEAQRNEHIKEIYDTMCAQRGTTGVSDETILQYATNHLNEVTKQIWWANDLYMATVLHEPNGWAHITFKRNDGGTNVSWQEKQWLKSDVLGEDCEALELFPAESRVVETAGYHYLWGKKELAVGFPVDYTAYDVVSTFAKQDDDD